MTKLEKALSIANQVEKAGVGFFTRNSDNTMTIFIRGAHGNDPNQWENARRVESALGVLARDVQPDGMSGHIVIKTAKVYGGAL